jgi:hypothetical protein
MEEVMLYDFISLMNDFVNQTWFIILTIVACFIIAVIDILILKMENLIFQKRIWFLISILSLIPILNSLFSYAWIIYEIFLLIFLISFISYILVDRSILIEKQKSDISEDEAVKILFKYTSKQLKHPKDFPELFKVLC